MEQEMSCESHQSNKLPLRLNNICWMSEWVEWTEHSTWMLAKMHNIISQTPCVWICDDENSKNDMRYRKKDRTKRNFYACIPNDWFKRTQIAKRIPNPIFALFISIWGLRSWVNIEYIYVYKACVALLRFDFFCTMHI